MGEQKKYAITDFVWTSGPLAEAAGVSVGYISKLCRDERLVAFKIGNNWVIEDESARRWLRTRRKPGRPPKDERERDAEQLDLDLE